MPKALRSARERLHQTLWFEGLGLAMVAPLFGLATGTGLGASVVLIAALSLVVTTWAALFNTVFDWVEHRRTGRVASERPHRWRVVHAVLLEGTAVAASCPVIVALTPLGWWDALLADLALTLVYMVYGYLFHWVYDRLRPVQATS